MKLTYFPVFVVFALATKWSSLGGLAIAAGDADEKVEPNVKVVNQITAAMVDAAGDSSSQVRQAAISYLANEKPKVAMDVFRKAINDEDANVRIEVLKGMVEVAGPTDEVMQTLMKHLSERETVRVAWRLIQEMGDPAVPDLLRAITDNTPQKKQAIELLGEMTLDRARFTECVNVLVKSLKDENDEVRLAAALSLTNIKQAIQKYGPNDPNYKRYEAYPKSYIRKYDIDKDGLLSANELSSIRRQPKWIDLNSDGQMSVEEMARAIMRPKLAAE